MKAMYSPLVIPPRRQNRAPKTTTSMTCTPERTSAEAQKKDIRRPSFTQRDV